MERRFMKSACSASHNDRARLARAVLDRGHCVNAALTQTYPRKAS